MPEQHSNLLSSFLTQEQLQAIMKLKESLRPEEISELRSAGERLLKNVKTEKDLANLIDSAAKSGSMPEIKSPRLRKMVGGMARTVSSRDNGSTARKGSTKSSATRRPASPARSRRKRIARKRP